MEQRFLLSVEGVVPPPPPIQAVPALEAPLNTDASAQSSRLSASSAPIQYTIQGAQGNAASTLPAATDLGGVAATTPTILAIDPSLPNAVSRPDKPNEIAAATAPTGPATLESASKVSVPAGSAVEATASTVQNGLAPQVLAEVSRSNTADAPVQISLAAYAAFVQSRPAPAQVIIVDGGVSNYATLVKSIVNFGAAEGTSGELPASGPATGKAPIKQVDAAPQLDVPGSYAVPETVDHASSVAEPILLVSRYGDTEIVVLDANHDGIDQVTDILSSYHGLAAVQVLSHGASGTLRLGTSQINDGKLDQDRERIAAWGRALRPGGDILLYGCDVAKGPEGMSFVENLAKLTGADVVASTNATGSAALGGDWTLEYSTGLIESAPLFQAASLDSYQDLLTGLAPAVLGGTVTFTGSAGADTLHLRVNVSGSLEYEWDNSGSYSTVGGFTLSAGGINVDLQDGNDVVIFDADHNFALGGGVNVNAETITVSSGVVIGTGTASVSLIANAVANSSLGNAQAKITLDGAEISAANITLTATSSVTASSVLPFSSPIAAALINVTSNAEVVVKNAAKLTTTGALNIHADSVTNTSATSNAVGTSLVNADAAVSTSIVGATSKVSVTGSTVLNVGGALELSAVNNRTVTTTADGTAGGATAAGGSVAVATVTGDTQAYIDGGVTVTAGSIKVAASKVDNITTSAKSTSGGSTTGGGATQTETTLASNKAETSSGSITVAGAVAVTNLTSDSLAYVNTSGTVTSTGLLLVQSLNNSDASATADGSSIGSGAAGVGVAVAINNARAHNDAYLGGAGAGLVTAGSVSVEAKMAAETVVPAATPTQIFGAQATSGAGGGVAIAGSLALSVTDTTSTAVIKSGTTVNLPTGGVVTLTAVNTSSSNAMAQPTGIGAVSAGSVGVGASVALNIANNTTLAEVANGATITNAGNLTLAATSSNTVTTSAKAGGTAGGSGVGVGGAISTAVVNNSTTADIGTGSTLVLGGALSVTATHRGATVTSADGTAGGGAGGVGAVLGLNVVSDVTTATTRRNLTVGGDVTFGAWNSGASSVETKASAVGAK
ncbi:MAG: DUF4347 domain-containing protein, partial [Rhodocyclales bacterium]|nr:DUF4347 domain-containing protein [Rhodocyclales bacterium]